MNESSITELTADYPTIYVYLNELTPYPSNYNYHPEDQLQELQASIETFRQFKPIVVWRCRQSETLPDGNQLHEGLLYIICGHGMYMAALRAGRDMLEAKDITGVSREVAEAILMADNAAPLGGQPDMGKLAALMDRTRGLVADKPGLAAMLARLKEKAGKLEFNQEASPPEQFGEYDEGIETEYCCPKCGYQWAGSPK